MKLMTKDISSIYSLSQNSLSWSKGKLHIHWTSCGFLSRKCHKLWAGTEPVKQLLRYHFKSSPEWVRQPCLFPWGSRGKGENETKDIFAQQLWVFGLFYRQYLGCICHVCQVWKRTFASHLFFFDPCLQVVAFHPDFLMKESFFSSWNFLSLYDWQGLFYTFCIWWSDLLWHWGAFWCWSHWNALTCCLVATRRGVGIPGRCREWELPSPQLTHFPETLQTSKIL